MKVTIADLSERISFVFFPISKNSRGDIVKGSESTRCNVWAKVFPLTARISDDTPERKNTINYRVTVRYRTDILPDDEISWRGRRLKLLSPPYFLDGEKNFICMDCAEVVEDGKAYQSLP